MRYQVGDIVAATVSGLGTMRITDMDSLTYGIVKLDSGATARLTKGYVDKNYRLVSRGAINTLLDLV